MGLHVGNSSKRDPSMRSRKKVLNCDRPFPSSHLTSIGCLRLASSPLHVPITLSQDLFRQIIGLTDSGWRKEEGALLALQHIHFTTFSGFIGSMDKEPILYHSKHQDTELVHSALRMVPSHCTQPSPNLEEAIHIWIWSIIAGASQLRLQSLTVSLPALLHLMPLLNISWSPLFISIKRPMECIETSGFLWSALYVLGIVFALYVWRSGRRETGLPPGPPTLPILGNIHHLSNANRLQDYRWFQKMAETYGPVMSIKIGNSTGIVLTDDGTACRELFGKRPQYNGRPANAVSHLVGRGIHPFRQPHISAWRYDRKLFAQHFNSSLSRRSDQIRIQEAESTQLLKDLIDSTTTTTSYAADVNRYASSILTATTYGFRIPDRNHPIPHRHNHAIGLWSKMSKLNGQGAPPTDIWPLLDYLIPQFLFPWKEKCKKISDKLFGVYHELADISRTLDTRGVINDAFAHKLFAIQPNQPELTNDKLSAILAVTLEGGGNTLAGSLYTILLALLTHPEVQKKGRDEVDLICNEDSLPTWAQVERMQYIRSIGKESLRWRPPFPMGVTHALTDDQEYMGYKLPANSIIAPNIWAIHMNPTRYDEPEKFKPERFENHTRASGDYNAVPDHRARDHYAFFPGRRTCPGVYMAEQAQMLVTAKLLWAFDTVPPPGISISEIDTSYHTAFSGSTVRVAKPFPVVLKPRSEHRLQVILTEFAHLNTVFFPSFEHDIPIRED